VIEGNTMACHAIKTNQVGVLTGKLCRNYHMEGSLFCYQHQTITPEEHKNRWFRKFILGSDGNRFLYSYDESKKDRILGDLRDRIVVLTQEDIDKIPDRRWYIDIYLLLMEHGYIGLETNAHPLLYKKALVYLSEFWFLTNNNLLLPFSSLARKVQEILIAKDAQHLHHFLQMLPFLMKGSNFQGDLLLQRIISIGAFLSELTETDAAKELCWQPFREPLLNHYKDKLGEDHLLTSYMKDVYLSEFKQLYVLEKQIQKARTDTYKERLMAYCWHPDRFQTWCLDEEEKAENKILFG
jgi:hypothetical protein